MIRDVDQLDICKHCGNERMWVDCWQCGGEGWSQPGDLYELDPLWYDEDDVEPCQQCDSKGGWSVCFVCHPESAEDA